MAGRIRLGPVKVSHNKLDRAVQVLCGGGLLAYPTEAVFGLGCDPGNARAVWRLLQLKQRPVSKGLILVAATPSQLEPYILPPTRSLRERLDSTWPGPVTWLLPARPDVPGYLRGRHDTLAVRVSGHPVVRTLCLAFGGPLVSTSANPGGLAPARNILTVRRYFREGVDFMLNGPLGGLARPTEIRDAASGRVLRAAS